MLRLGIMQPYFFPYLGYFDLINCSDMWIVFDTSQYTRQKFMNRNRILKHGGGWQWMTVPIVRDSIDTAIKDISINNTTDWRRHILGQVDHYKKRAPYFVDVYKLLDKCLMSQETNLSRLSILTLKEICNYLEIPFNPKVFSEMDLDIGPVNEPGDWALQISVVLKADEYINPPGGRKILSEEKFNERGIKLIIRDPKPIEYKCRGMEFYSRLSIIDTLMWVSVKDIQAYLHTIKI